MGEHFYRPRDGHGLPHDPFNAIIAPRPIGWISSIDRSGIRNLAPYSFFNGFNYLPPIIGFSSIGYKDSVRNIESTGEFGWSLVTRPLAAQMNTTCAAVAPEVDEFQLAGLTPVPSREIEVPRVAESPVSFECRATQIIRLRDAEENELATWLVMGEVVAVHIDQALLNEGVYDTLTADPLSRGGGPGDYWALSAQQRFVLLRPEVRKP